MSKKVPVVSNKPVWSLSALLKKSKSSESSPKVQKQIEKKDNPQKSDNTNSCKPVDVDVHFNPFINEVKNNNNKSLNTFISTYNSDLNAFIASEDLSEIDNLQLFNLDGTLNSHKRVEEMHALPGFI